MGIAKEPYPAKPFLAVLSGSGTLPEPITRILEERLGPVDFVYGPVPFAFSDYYGEEMGAGLHKSYLTFSRCIKRDDLPDLKLLTNSMEQQQAVAGSRTINLDPGYLTRDKLVLATTKDFFHRLYLGKGIFGEVTLHYRGGRFRTFSWTYPDYRDPGFREFIQKPRAILVKQCRDGLVREAMDHADLAAPASTIVPTSTRIDAAPRE